MRAEPTLAGQASHVFSRCHEHIGPFLVNGTGVFYFKIVDFIATCHLCAFTCVSLEGLDLFSLKNLPPSTESV